MIPYQQPPALVAQASAAQDVEPLRVEAEQGDARAAYILARKTSEGAEDGKWIHFSALKGYAPARAFLADYYSDRAPLGNDSEARKALLAKARMDRPAIFQELLKGAESGDIECMTCLARFAWQWSPTFLAYQEGPTAAKNHGQDERDLRLRWLRRAMATGQKDSIFGEGLPFELAAVLTESEDPKEQQEGFRMLRQQAKGGNLPSALTLFQIYSNGDEKLGVKPDRAKAAYWGSVAERIQPESTITDD